MATYQEIKGRTVQGLASDPPAALGAGQVWYNTATDLLKTSVGGTKVWAAGGNITTPNYHMGATGSFAAAITCFGETVKTPSTFTKVTQEYDGTAWSTVNDALTARQQVGSADQAPQTASIMFGGTAPLGTSPDVKTTATEEYNGTSWTAGAAMNIARNAFAGGGTQTACFATCGSGAPGAYIDDTENFNGTAWSASGNYTDDRAYLSGAGTQTAGLAMTGWDPGTTGESATYDGATWTAADAMGTARYDTAGSGIQTNAMCYGGSNASAALTASEEYDGTSWTATPSLGTAYFGLGGAGTTTALAIGGYFPALVQVTQEYVGPDTVETITST